MEQLNSTEREHPREGTDGWCGGDWCWGNWCGGNRRRGDWRPDGSRRDDSHQYDSQQDPWFWGYWWWDAWRVDRVDAVCWTAALLWAFASIVLVSVGSVGQLASWNGWSLFLTGSGVIALAGALYRALWRVRPYRVFPGLMFGAMLLAMGLAGLGARSMFWCWNWVPVQG